MATQLLDLLKTITPTLASKASVSTSEPTTTRIAREVIAGDWGSGDTRTEKLKKAGYNPTIIQNEVNRILSSRELIIDNQLKWAQRIIDTKKYKYIAYSEQYGKECAVCHPHGGANHGWQCIGYGVAVWHHGGLPNKCHCSVIDNGTGERILKAKTDAEALKIAQNALGLKDIQVIRNNGKVIPKALAQPGDIALMFVDGNVFKHVYIIGKNNKITDATRAGGYGKDIKFRTFGGRYVSAMKVLIRYTGKGLCSCPPKTIDEVAHEVINGLWLSGDSRKKALTEAGFDYNAVQKRVNEILNPTPIPTPTPSKKTVDELAQEVLDGKWGSGDIRKKKITQAGYDYDTVQQKVNELIVDKIAKEVIAGKWGSGDTRKKKLTKAGYNYNKIQQRVNEILAKEKTAPSAYPGVLPTLRVVKSNAQVISDTIKWAKWIAGDNRFHYGHGKHAHHNGCYFCGTQKLKKGHGIVDYQFTYCCNPFVGAAWAHGGCVPKAISLCQNCKSWDFNKGSGYDASNLFTKLGHPAKSKLKAGDVLCSGSHVALYIGNGKLAEASGGDDNKKNSQKWNNSIHIINMSDSKYNSFKRVYRYNSSVNADIIMCHGEAGDRVALWQTYLNWWSDGQFFKECGEADGLFGDNTLKWTKKFQEEVIGKGQGDGKVGNITLTAAAKVKK